MGSTVNYDLNIPSGSDQVNILTQITPNFETIDEVMKANEDAGIHVATELFSNNIHALTRTKGDAPAMRFTATSNYTAGDTFTVDGVQVTALAPNGATLPDNAYVIGCEVFAILKGMRLTVWAGSRATDSEKLNGEAASFYATKAEVDNAQDLAEGAATVAQEALDAIPKKTKQVLANGCILTRYGKHRQLDFIAAPCPTVLGLTLASGDRPSENVRNTAVYYNYMAQIFVSTAGKITGDINSTSFGGAWTALKSTNTANINGQISWVVD